MTRYPPTPTAEDVVARPALSATSYYPFAVFVNVRSLELQAFIKILDDVLANPTDAPPTVPRPGRANPGAPFDAQLPRCVLFDRRRDRLYRACPVERPRS
jgi:hypothetical protein